LDPFPRMFRHFKGPSRKVIRYLNYIELVLNDLDWQYDRDTIRAYRVATQEARDAIAREGYRKNVVRFFRNHKNAIESAYQAANNRNVRSKYVFLGKYHNEMVASYLAKAKDDLKVILTRTNSKPQSRRVTKNRTLQRQGK